MPDSSGSDDLPRLTFHIFNGLADTMTNQAIDSHITHIVAALEKCVGYGRSLLPDIDPATFAHMPMANFNHPAFNYGHLSFYPNFWFEMVGRPDAVSELPYPTEVYAHGSECVEQDGRYASMDVITSAFFETHERAMEILPTVDPDLLRNELPEGPYRDFFGLVGNALTFMTCSHTMMHLGQVSMWRRAMGLGSCM